MAGGGGGLQQASEASRKGRRGPPCPPCTLVPGKQLSTPSGLVAMPKGDMAVSPASQLCDFGPVTQHL